MDDDTDKSDCRKRSTSPRRREPLGHIAELGLAPSGTSSGAGGTGGNLGLQREENKADARAKIFSEAEALIIESGKVPVQREEASARREVEASQGYAAM